MLSILTPCKNFQIPLSKVIRIFGIAGNGKGEVYHVGETIKVDVRRETTRKILLNSSDIRNLLEDKF